jgi:ATP-dependent Clp protease adaptor protein ClpS
MPKTQSRTIPRVVELSKTQLEPLYRVIIHNDDVTPMDFVVHVLEQIFLLDNSQAVAVMLIAHQHGNAYVQTLPKNEAQKRIGKAHFAAGLEGYPLRFTIEPE